LKRGTGGGRSRKLISVASRGCGGGPRMQPGRRPVVLARQQGRDGGAREERRLRGGGGDVLPVLVVALDGDDYPFLCILFFRFFF
jgi:hypothetical protein